VATHYFIAIPLSLSLKDYFSTWQEELYKTAPFKHWPNKYDLHITLKFLGPVKDEQLSRLQKELKQIETFKQFKTYAGGSIGVFGNPVKPRVLWAGVNLTDPLTKLHQQVEACALNAGFSSEFRDYRPHITLAKKWNGQSARELMQIIRAESHYKNQQLFKINEIVIYQIFPKDTPKYKIVQRFQLDGGEEDSSTN